MPLYKVKGTHLVSKKECELELADTTSILDVKKAIGDKLGIEASKHNFKYKGHLVIYQDTLKDLNCPPDAVIDLLVSPKLNIVKPSDAFALLGLPSFGPGGIFSSGVPADDEDSFDSDDDDPRAYNLIRPFDKVSEFDGKVADPRKWCTARHSDFLFILQLMISRDYHAPDSNKSIDYLAAEIDKIIASMTYDELEYLATECLRIDRLRMETLRDEYYKSFEKKAQET